MDIFIGVVHNPCGQGAIPCDALTSRSSCLRWIVLHFASLMAEHQSYLRKRLAAIHLHSFFSITRAWDAQPGVSGLLLPAVSHLLSRIGLLCMFCLVLSAERAPDAGSRGSRLLLLPGVCQCVRVANIWLGGWALVSRPLGCANLIF